MKSPMVVGLACLLLLAVVGCSKSSNMVASRRYSQASDSSFAVGASSVLEASSFAGAIRVVSGAGGTIGVSTRTWVERTEHFDDVVVEVSGANDTVRVNATNPASLNGATVDVDATIPGDALADLHVGAGTIEYEGRPTGACVFGAGAGDITIMLPADANVTVNLSVGAGAVQVDFPVSGTTGTLSVVGTIGTGVDGSIVATAGAGNILVKSQ